MHSLLLVRVARRNEVQVLGFVILLELKLHILRLVGNVDAFHFAFALALVLPLKNLVQVRIEHVDPITQFLQVARVTLSIRGFTARIHLLSKLVEHADLAVQLLDVGDHLHFASLLDWANGRVSLFGLVPRQCVLAVNLGR